MKKWFAIIGLILLLLASNCKNFPDTEGYDLYHGTVDRVAVWNSDSSYGKSILVYKPYEYCESCSDSLPVIYILAPYSMSADEFTSVYPIFDMFDRMLSAKVLPPMLVVVVDGFNEASDEAFDGNYEDFIAENVMNEVASNYHAFTDSSYNGVIGVGPMSGYNALKLYLDHPAKFGCAAAHSPMVNPMDYVENYLLSQALYEGGGSLPNPPSHIRAFPHIQELLSLGLAISPKIAPLDSFDLRNEFPIRQLSNSSWLGAILPWDTLGNPVDDSALLATWSDASLLKEVSDSIDNVWDTASIWIDLGTDDNPVLSSPINAFIDSLNAYDKRPVFERYEHDIADPDSVVPVKWDNYLIVRLNYSIGHLLKVMWFR